MGVQISLGPFKMMDPVLFSIGNLEVRWYGILMALAYLAGFFISKNLAKKRNISQKNIEDFFLYLIISAIIGARLLHVIQNYSLYNGDFIRIISIWNGGLSFFGGFIAVLLTSIYFCKKRNIDFYDLADIFVIPLSLGLFIGRIGNFINQEHYGKLTNLPWGVNFDNLEGKRHPTQLYESLTHLITFYITNKLFLLEKLPKGFIFYSFLSLYGIFRFFTDFFRDQGTWILNLTMAQYFSLIFIIIGLFNLKKLYPLVGKNL